MLLTAMWSQKIFYSTPNSQSPTLLGSRTPNYQAPKIAKLSTPKSQTPDSTSLSRKIFRSTPNFQLCPQNCQGFELPSPKTPNSQLRPDSPSLVINIIFKINLNVFYSFKGYIRIAKCNVALGDANAALAVLRQASELDPNNKAVRDEMGNAQALIKCCDEVEKAIARPDYRMVNQFLIKVACQIFNTRFTPSLKFYTFNLSQSVKFFSLVSWYEHKARDAWFYIFV